MRTTVKQMPQTLMRMLKPRQSVSASAWQLAATRSLPQLQGGPKLQRTMEGREPFPHL